MIKVRRTVRELVNTGLNLAGLELIRKRREDYVKTFLPLKDTLEGARRAKLSVAEYVDLKYQVPGATQATIDQMEELGVFNPKVSSVCEIGPGSGRYLEKVQRLCSPCTYEVYETEREWSDWLAQTYGVKACEADGKCLNHTASDSIDLALAHKVFVYLPFVVTCNYFNEMARITRKGGRIVFDVVSETCMTDTLLERWIAAQFFYPSMMPSDFVIDFFTKRGCSLRSRFFAFLKPGQSEYLVFTKESTQVSRETVWELQVNH
jgi:ubiquinone/menaquinone biosynthesis C-methylase UbiE